MGTLPDPDASQALLIGVHTYENLEDLPAVEHNLAGLTRAFTDQSLWGLPPSHCVTLPQPHSAQAVLDTLSGVAARACDTLIVYYSGHGLTDPHSDELYLALPGSDQERMYTTLPYEWLRRAVLHPRVRARRKVVILDCCYSGRALLGGMSGTDQVADQALIEGTCLLAASAETRRALSPPGEEFTAFTGELITVLTDGIADGPPLLDMDTLYRHLYATLAAKARPLPQQRNRNTGGLIALARNRTHFSDSQDSRAAQPPLPAPPSDSSPAFPSRPASPPRPASRARAASPVNGPSQESPAAVGEQHSPNPPLRQEAAPEAVVIVPGERRGKISAARVMVGTAAVLGLLAVGIPIALSWREDSAGQKDGASRTGFDAATSSVVNASDTKGGTLKFIGSQDADSWDPQRGYRTFMWNFARYYTRQLVTYAPEPGPKGAELVPDLATSTAKISNGGKTYTYTLRDGVTWEDGSPITSADIKYGIERIWAQDVISGGPLYLQQALDPEMTYRGPYKDTSLKAIETPDDKTIVFKLPKPNADFEQMLAMPSGSPVKAAKDTRSKYGLDPFSSGPYIFQSYRPNQSLVLVRNPHWDKSSDPIRAALPDKITVTITTNPAELELRLLKGDYDLDLNATGLSKPGITKTLADADLKKNLDNPETGVVRYAAFPQSVKPLDNIHCRKAIAYATDKKSLQTARGGPQTGGAIAPNMLPPSIRGAEPTFDPYGVLKNGGEPNLTRAKEELKACGRPNGFSTTIAVRNTPVDLSSAESLRYSLNKAGIKARIETIDTTQFGSVTGDPQVVKDKGYGIIITGWVADFPTGLGFLQPLVDGRYITPSSNFNFGEINDPTINRLFDKAAAEAAPEKADEIYRQINHRASEKAYYLPFVYEKSVTWRNSRLTNVYTTDAYGDCYNYASLGINDN
ncbi:ABC transporter substrate-binding protein [Streptomyces sp. NPDC088116]|uniref:caspase, EACC1-associated type n=1 Tax=Streptomyces sp. NPDC088116 TaxID=3365825 RepID=UPI003817E468